jgi:glucose/arabinose dehydrogenase
MKYISFALSIVLLVVIVSCINVNTAGTMNPLRKSKTDLPLDKIIMPEGFDIDIYATGVINARGMDQSPSGTLFVGSRGEGAVYALKDLDGDFHADTMFTIDEDLKLPVGVAFHKGDLYVSAVSQILKYENIEERLGQDIEPVVVYNKFPTETHHGWKYIAFGPDEKLYVPVGAPCNICESEDKIFNSISRINPDGTDLEIIAEGVRNSVGFDWHPETGELYFTENGRDMLGNDKPTCELNRLQNEGDHFGYPYCHQGDIADPEFGEKRSCDEFVKPFQNLGPHVAPLGMEFYEGSQFPSDYKNRMIIAEHGSWNRDTPIGYRLSMVAIDEAGKSKGYDMFAEGWLQDGKAWGRPVDIEQLKDGSILVSDDFADVIYRIYYKG